MTRPASVATVPVRQVRRPETLTEAVIGHIREAVVRGELPPGSSLPEVQLSEQLETSRGTVREALRALQDIGLVEVLPHRGAFVTDISPRKARELVELRSLLEGFAARLAVERTLMDAQARARLESAYRQMLQAAHEADQSRSIETHLDFHLAVAESGGNEMLVENLEPLQIQTRRLIMYTDIFSAGHADEHRTIIDAIVGSDADAAERVVRDHIRRSGEVLLAHLADLRTPREA